MRLKRTWNNRYAERSDLTTSLVHLTKSVADGNKKKDAFRVLFEILEAGKLLGSTTDSGFIVGDTPAVCLQDAPLQAVCQNCWFEEKWRKKNAWAKIRYIPTETEKGARLDLIFNLGFLYKL